MEASAAVSNDTEFVDSDWLVAVPTYPEPMYLPTNLMFSNLFTGKVQLTNLEGREVLHAELNAQKSLMLPPSGLRGTYILRLIDLESKAIMHSQKVVFK